jgi:hypothetical protein
MAVAKRFGLRHHLRNMIEINDMSGRFVLAWSLQD